MAREFESHTFRHIRKDTLDVLIGKGQIGTAIQSILEPDISYDIIDGAFPDLDDEVDFLHIAIPYSDQFIDIVNSYIDRLTFTEDGGTIVYSTVKIGTCSKIKGQVAHSPVEGVHPRLAESILRSNRWIGCSDIIFAEYVKDMWSDYTDVVIVHKSEYTEFMKLRSTAKYGINLVWTDYENQIAEAIGMPFEYIKYFDQDYNDLYSRLGNPEYQRYILDPPEGHIGGHCVVPNAELLNEQYPSELLDKIIEMK
jgi:hypothetical protein